MEKAGGSIRCAGPLDDELRHRSGCKVPLGCNSGEFTLTCGSPQKSSVNGLKCDT